MKALVIGATGATGKDIVDQLLQDDDFSQVDIFVRRAVDTRHPKLKVHVVDFNDIHSWESELQGDVLFSALGTTRKQAGGKEAQWKVDYSYQYETAKAARKNGVTTHALVSAFNADPQSSFFYPQLKVALEDAVLALGYPKNVIMRPPSLIRKGSDRFEENISVKVLQFINRFGFLKEWSPMPTEMVAEAMIEAAKESTPGLTTLGPEEIRRRTSREETTQEKQ